MPSLNSVQLIGNLGQDPDTKTIPGDRLVTTFRLATNERWKDGSELKTRTEWHNIEVWGNQAKTCADHLKTGRLVMIVGALRTDQWEKDGKPQSRTKVVAQRVLFLDGPDKQAAGAGEDTVGDQGIPF
jgi:single-strand DNA-binding protein